MTYEAYRHWKQTPLAGDTDLTVVIPTYNEAQRIVPTIAAVASYLCDRGLAWELIVSDDGSTDDTTAIVEQLDMANLVVIAADENRGKGAAVRAGMRAARGRHVLFSDADLSTPIGALPRFLAALDDGADIAVASRNAHGAGEASRSRLRRLLSAVFRTFVAVLFPVGTHDTQCGFKLFSADAAEALTGRQTIDGFSFDLELLWLARQSGMRTDSVAVRWTDAPGSKVQPGRDAARFLADMVRIRWRHRGPLPAFADAGTRIAVVSPYPPSPHTLNEYGAHLVAGLSAKQDVRSVVVLADDESAGARPPHGVVIDTCWRFDDLRTPFRIAAAVRRHRPDAVLFNIQFASFGQSKLAAGLGLLTPALVRLLGTRSIVLLHNLVDTVDLGTAGIASNRLEAGLLRGMGHMLTRVLLRAHRVAVTIPDYVDLLEQRYQASNVYLAPHGSFGDAVEPDLGVPERPRILAFGKFGTYKRVDDLVAAYRGLLAAGYEDLELVIAGTDSPNSLGYVNGIARANDDLPHLHFTGYVAEDDVAALFHSATVVVFPYTGTTGSSGPLHQAGEHGRAVVLPEIGDFLALIADEGYTGETFEPGNLASLRTAIQRLLDDPARRHAIAAQNGRAATGCTLADVADLHLLHIHAA